MGAGERGGDERRRAARNVNGKVVMYADTITQSMSIAIEETKRRRKIQMEYNKTHNLTPKSVSNYQETTEKANLADPVVPYTRSTDLSKLIKETALG